MSQTLNLENMKPSSLFHVFAPSRLLKHPAELLLNMRLLTSIAIDE